MHAAAQKFPELTRKSAVLIMMWSQLEDENAKSRRQHAQEEFRMMVAAILLSILAGFGAGYTMRAWRSRRRRVRHPLYQPYDPAMSQPGVSLARAKRAF
jgi:hypothetical protein